MHLSGEQMGSEPPLPFLSPELRGQRLLVGANFASAGIGILNDTGVQFVSNLSGLFLSDQLILSNFLLSVTRSCILVSEQLILCGLKCKNFR